MNYGKNQQALLKFLQKHPNRWHKIVRKKAVNTGLSLYKKAIGIDIVTMYLEYPSSNKVTGLIRLNIPQMLREQA